MSSEDRFLSFANSFMTGVRRLGIAKVQRGEVWWIVLVMVGQFNIRLRLLP